MSWALRHSFLILLIALGPVALAAPLTEGPPPPPLPLPDLIDHLPDLPHVPALPPGFGGTWVWILSNGEWVARWVPEGSEVWSYDYLTNRPGSAAGDVATPEPSAWMLLAAGLGVLGLARRRR